ncbi:LysR substrate-binding domain-containing protein [Pseudonocardia xinjiangensis]|uniref:LysR family transcriptional regulator n=1 Tax=Pseudonocardia xinjiangensis TaxID=75289 RepID=A0ABX1RJ58_9PSEU|nr:LysR family transcriptional regulator [Pseudonocardia xinjiangensis]
MVEELSLRQLSHFVAAAEAGSMTKAAQALHVSQSAVSLGVADLERQLGVQLLLRQRAKGLTLTAAGQRLITDARALLGRAEELRVGAQDLGRSPRGRLVVGCFQTIGPFVMPGLLGTFHAEHPGVDLDFVEGSLVDLQSMLLAGRCEVALLYDMDIMSGIERETVYTTTPYVLLAPEHPLADDLSVRLSDLAAHDMIMLDFPPSRHHFSSVLAAAGVIPRIRHSTANFEMVRSLVARGYGFSMLIQRLEVEVSYEGLPLVTRPLADPIDPTPVVLAWPTSVQLTRRAQAFMAHCRKVLQCGPSNRPSWAFLMHRARTSRFTSRGSAPMLAVVTRMQSFEEHR